MSTRYNTGNPIESTDVRDMSDNAKNLDLFSNSSDMAFDDRFGVERKTIHGMNSEFNSQVLNMGFTRIGTFASGATLTNPRQTLLWDVANGGDGQEYGWSGTFPKIVHPSSTPSSTGGIAVGAWMSRFDPELKVQVREALRRSYAEAGYHLVAGSFEAGGTLVNANDVLLNDASGVAYSYSGVLPKAVPPGSTPSGTGGVSPTGSWVDVGDATVYQRLTNDLSEHDGERFIGACPDIATLRTIEPTGDLQRIPVIGYYSDTPLLGGGDFISDMSDVTTPDNGVTVIVTSGGGRWKRKGNILRLDVECGGMGVNRSPDENSAAWDRLVAALPSTGGTLLLNDFYTIKYGVIVPPRVTLFGVGADSCGLIKAGNYIKTVPDRLWQGISRSYSKDFILAIDLDSDTSGNLDGNQTRATRLDGFSLLCTSGTKNAYGIYGTISYNVSIGDVFVKNVTTMLETDDSWLWNVKILMGQDVVNGFVVKTGGTSFNLADVYVRNATGVAFDLKNITYSNLTTCAADFVTGTAYKFKDCTGVNLDGCGAESITGKVLDIEGSRVSFSALRGVGIASDGGAGVRIKDSAVSMRASFLPDFSNGTANKYLSIDNSTLNLNNVVIPYHTDGRILWGAGQSAINISQYNGNFTVYGNSAWVVLGTLVSGMLTVINSTPPDSSVNFLPVGARWIIQAPAAGAIHTYVHVGGGVWKPAGSVAA